MRQERCHDDVGKDGSLDGCTVGPAVFTSFVGGMEMLRHLPLLALLLCGCPTGDDDFAPVDDDDLGDDDAADDDTADDDDSAWPDDDDLDDDDLADDDAADDDDLGDDDLGDDDSSDDDDSGDDDDSALSAPALHARTCPATSPEPDHPSLHVAGGALHLFFGSFDNSGDRATFELTAPLSTLAYGAQGASLVPGEGPVDLAWMGGGGLHALFAHGTTTSLLADSGGGSWVGEATFAAADGVCTGARPARLSRPWDASSGLLDLGFHHDSGVFGCGPQAHLFSGSGASWADLGLPLTGDPAGLAITAGHLVQATGTEVRWSADDGVTWTTVPSGSTTNSQVRGSAMVLDSTGVLHLVQIYAWASQHHVDLLSSVDGGVTWSRQNLRQTAEGQVALQDPRLATDGTSLLVAWRELDISTWVGGQPRGSAVARISEDLGLTWSAPVLCDDAGPTESASAVEPAAGDGRLFLAYGVSGSAPIRVCTVELLP